MRLYATGATRRAILEGDLRHLLMRLRGYRDRMRRQEMHLIGLRNEVRSAFGADPIDPYSGPSSPSAQDTETMQAFKHRVRETTDLDWTTDLTTTHT